MSFGKGLKHINFIMNISRTNSENLTKFKYSQIYTKVSQISSSVSKCRKLETGKSSFNPLSHMQILGSSSSTANKDILSKIVTNGGKSF